MGVFFGTDGIRGIVNDSLTFEIAYKCGNVLAQNKNRCRILIGGDTRLTRSYLISAFAGGAMSVGAEVIDVGVLSTPGIAYLTNKLGFDYGVVISASHNPAEFNGIKILGSSGMKLGDRKEDELERKFFKIQNVDIFSIGSYEQNMHLPKIYENYLLSICNCRLDGLKVVLDAGNGAVYKVAPKVFRKLGAKVIAINARGDGKNINNHCGATSPNMLAKAVKKYRADVGFAFDGDADRIIAVDENGEIVDGDQIIYILAKYMSKMGKLNKNSVVGTSHTNMGIELSLNKLGIKLIRTDIGDKYVSAKLNELNLNLGGEKSGHIIIKDLLPTGDGLLTAIKMAELIKVDSCKLSEINDAILFPQCNIDCVVSDKMKVINSEKLQNEINNQEKILGEDSRILVRVSGTEPKIRIMCESRNDICALTSARAIEKVIKNIDRD